MVANTRHVEVVEEANAGFSSDGLQSRDVSVRCNLSKKRRLSLKWRLVCRYMRSMAIWWKG